MNSLKVIGIGAIILALVCPAHSLAAKRKSKRKRAKVAKADYPIPEVGARCRLRTSVKAHQELDGVISVLSLKRGTFVEIVSTGSDWVEFKSRKKSGLIWKRLIREYCRPAKKRIVAKPEEKEEPVEVAAKVEEPPPAATEPASEPEPESTPEPEPEQPIDEELPPEIEPDPPARWVPWAVASAALLVTSGTAYSLGAKKSGPLKTDVEAYNAQTLREQEEYQDLVDRGQHIANLETVSVNTLIMGTAAAALSFYIYSEETPSSGGDESSPKASESPSAWQWFGTPWGISIRKQF